MRAEYFEAIRYRRWHELEMYAKRRPEQALADTVFQLANSIGDKEDRRALRKVLWILSEAGFEGRDYEEEPAKPAPRPKSKHVAAAMNLGDPHGYTNWLLCSQHGGGIDSLMLLILDRWGFCIARPLQRVPPQRTAFVRDNWIKNSPNLAAAVDPDYAHYRIARAYSRKKPGIPPDDTTVWTGFWKKLFSEFEPMPHPSAAMRAPKLDRQACTDALQQMWEVQRWTLSLPPTDDVWAGIHPIRWNDELTVEERQGEIAAVLSEHKAALFESAFEELSERLRDAAYIFHSNDDPRGEMLLGVAHEFERTRERSAFAELIIATTAAGIATNLEEDEFDPSSANWD